MDLSPFPRSAFRLFARLCASSRISSAREEPRRQTRPIFRRGAGRRNGRTSIPLPLPAACVKTVLLRPQAQAIIVKRNDCPFRPIRRRACEQWLQAEPVSLFIAVTSSWSVESCSPCFCTIAWSDFCPDSSDFCPACNSSRIFIILSSLFIVLKAVYHSTSPSYYRAFFVKERRTAAATRDSSRRAWRAPQGCGTAQEGQSHHHPENPPIC